MFQTPQKHLEKTFFQVILSRAWARPGPGPGPNQALSSRPGPGPGPARAERGPNAGPSQHMNFNFFLKNQFWSYEHACKNVCCDRKYVSFTHRKVIGSVKHSISIFSKKVNLPFFSVPITWQNCAIGIFQEKIEHFILVPMRVIGLEPWTPWIRASESAIPQILPCVSSTPTINFKAKYPLDLKGSWWQRKGCPALMHLEELNASLYQKQWYQINYYMLESLKLLSMSPKPSFSWPLTHHMKLHLALRYLKVIVRNNFKQENTSDKVFNRCTKNF